MHIVYTLYRLTQTATKLDEKLKAYALAEGEIQALKRKISLLEDELERLNMPRYIEQIKRQNCAQVRVEGHHHDQGAL